MSEPEVDWSTWEGDWEKLRPYLELLSWSPELCERTFPQKHDAFLAGVMFGEAQQEER